jgi:thymidylate synthase ThyX
MQTVSLESYSRRHAAPAGSSLINDIAYFARVSNPTSQISALNDEKLIKYLIRHRHWSPFEMAHITILAETSRDVARQMLRHRSFSFQEFSQRYSATETNGDRREARLQDLVNRQNSLETDDEGLIQWWRDVQDVGEGGRTRHLARRLDVHPALYVRLSAVLDTLHRIANGPIYPERASPVS